MSIAFFINALWNAGGTERITTVIAGELVKRGIDADIITIHAGESFFKLDPRISVINLTDERQTKVSQHYLQYTRKLRSVLKRKRYDFLIDVCTAMSLMSIPAAAGLPTKIISWEHFNANVNWNRMTGLLARNAAARFARRIVVLTDGDKAVFERKFGARNAVCITNPLTIEPGEPSPLTERRVLAVGRFTPQKGFDLLLDAWAESKIRHEDWKLRIVGAGETEPEIREKIERLGLAGSVEIVPPVHDMGRMYREASIFVLSSRFEGFGLVLVEAAATGLPAVSFDCDHGPREIIENERTGVLVPPEDVTALAAAIDRVAGDWDSLVSMGRAALVRSRLFSLDTIADEWVALLEGRI